LEFALFVSLWFS